MDEPDKLHYAVWQLEECPTTNKRHVQGYVVFTQDRTFKTVTKLFPGAHIEKARSSDSACYKYCTKEETRVSGPFHYGERPKVREDLRKSDYMKLVAYTEGSLSVTDILARIIRFYFEQQRCEPPEIRIKTLATSIMMHNAYKYNPAIYSSIEMARAQRMSYGIFERPEDYIAISHASQVHKERQTPETSGNRCPSSPVSQEEEDDL